MSWCNIIHCERNVLQTRSENSENIGKGFFYYDLSSDARKKHFYRLENHSKLTFFFPPLYISDNHGQRSWDWAFSSSHRSNFSPHTTNNVRRVYPEFFPRFNLYRVGGRDNCKKISKRMHCFMKEHRMTEKYEYCITVPRSFVHDCSVRRRHVIFLVLSF